MTGFGDGLRSGVIVGAGKEDAAFFCSKNRCTFLANSLDIPFIQRQQIETEDQDFFYPVIKQRRHINISLLVNETSFQA